jgi:calcium-dependent protein kinase
MHRDIKPENIILISKSVLSKLKIVDFGFACEVNQNNFLFKKCGTPGFVAPEVFNACMKMYNEKCDIFSAGIIFY